MSELTYFESRNLVFRDEATRKKAFWTLEGKPARKFLDEFAQYDMYYVAVCSEPLLSDRGELELTTDPSRAVETDSRHRLLPT